MSNPIRKGSVLLIDDEINVLHALRRQLKRDFNVHIASTAEEGFAILHDNTIDVVISDQRMPNVPGNEFLAKVHQDWPRTSLILLTGYSDMSAIVDSVNRAHIFAYVEKPWNIDALRAMVQSAFLESLKAGNKGISSVAKTVTEDVLSGVAKLCQSL